MRAFASFVTALILMAGPLIGEVHAVGKEGYNGIITWDANKETDLAGYRVWRRATNDPNAPRTLVKDVPASTLTLSTADAKLPAGQHYFSLTAYDRSQNESIESGPLVPFVQLFRDLRPNTFVVSNVTENAARVSFKQDPLAKANIRWMVTSPTKPFNWGQAASIECPLNVCELKNLPSGSIITFQGIGYTGEMNTPSVTYTEFATQVSFSTKAVIIVEPPPDPDNAIAILLNKGNNIVAQYKAARCPKGIRQITSGTTTKIVTWTCVQ